MLNVEDKLAKVFKIYRHEIFFIPSFLMLFNSYSTIRVVYELFSESYLILQICQAFCYFSLLAGYDQIPC